MQRVEGPECRNCGCTASEPWGQQTVRWGQVLQRRVCQNCGTLFEAPVKIEPVKIENGEIPPDHQTDEHEPGGVQPYDPVRCRCPACGRINPKVQGTKRTEGGAVFRQHKCPTCETTFQSREAEGE